jgi:hypothetical protein
LSARCDLGAVLLGNILYSAVTQPFVESFGIHRGSSSEIDAVHKTTVSPAEIRTLPAARFVKSDWMVIGRSWFGRRPSILDMVVFSD